MKSFIKKIVREVLDKLITCKKCGWQWKKSDGGPDMYFCHKCGFDNTPDNITENKTNKAAGVFIKCLETNEVLLLLRNDKKPTWSCLAGTIEKGETSKECLIREIKEELSIDPTIIKLNKIGVEHNEDKNLDFHYYEGFTSSKFLPKLNGENLKYGWFSKDEIPTPLFKGTTEKLKNIWKNH